MDAGTVDARELAVSMKSCLVGRNNEELTEEENLEERVSMKSGLVGQNNAGDAPPF